MKNHYLLLSIPLVAGILALVGCGYIFHLIFALSCTALVLLFPHEELKPYIWLIALAFVLSIGGDWMLKFKDTIPIRFVYGIALYFLAHVSYFIFFLKNGKFHIPTFTVLLAVYGLFYIMKLIPAIPDNLLLVAVLFYLVISCCTFSAAIGLNLKNKVSKYFFIAGIASLVFSDTLIALKEFLQINTLYGWMMPTFYCSYMFATIAAMRK